MRLVEHPLVRDFLLLLSIVVLIIFCFDKSRQNKRTRFALYNCVYPLYGSAVLKAAQLLDALLPFGAAGHLLGLFIVAASLPAYWRWFKPQADIPYNRLFHGIGWGVLAILLAFYVALSVFDVPQRM